MSERPPLGIVHLKEQVKNELFGAGPNIAVVQSPARMRSNITGVGVGRKTVHGIETPTWAIKVYVVRKLPRGTVTRHGGRVIPAKIGGVSTDVVEVGVIHTFQSRTSKFRPMPGGISIGHPSITAGTLGSRVIDLTNQRRAILSNWHVLKWDKGEIGDPIYQPGPIDGGTADDTVATLTRWVDLPPPSGQEALVDAALATPTSDGGLLDNILGAGIYSNYVAQPVIDAAIGMAVKKSGRSSNVTLNRIIDVNATLDVEGYSFGTQRFTDQIVVQNPFSEPGDSGSMPVEASSNSTVGLLFGGSAVITTLNKATNVVRLLNIDVPQTTQPVALSGTAVAALLVAFVGSVLLLRRRRA